MKSVLFAARDRTGEARPAAAGFPRQECLSRPGLEAELPTWRAMARQGHAGLRGE